ncbi:type IV secretion system protein [Povalibacter sp.]|uniref:type IV secretion system protein n=1 Tax=Povalibacter sp. TaxID=1962978 RepID=UPI002D1F9B8E|nr:type IV secretion system protein [Povalibacter sp.]
MANILEPVVVSLGVLYIIVWGYLQLMGKVEEPFMTGMKRIFTLGIIMGASIQLWAFHELMVDTFFNVPAALGAQMVGAFDQVEVVDAIFFRGFDAARLLVDRGTIFDDNIIFFFVGGAVYLIVFLTGVYTLFLLTLSRIALSVLLALGPLFIALLLFETTKKFFESWIAQLANYGFIALLTTLVAALMMTVVLKTAEAAVRIGGEISVADAARLLIAAGLTFLVMRQVMPMAAGLASGLALSTFGVVSAGLKWGLGTSSRSLGHFARGLTDTQTTRWDSYSRKAGHWMRRGVVSGARWAGRRDNYVRRAW